MGQSWNLRYCIPWCRSREDLSTLTPFSAFYLLSFMFQLSLQKSLARDTRALKHARMWHDNFIQSLHDDNLASNIVGDTFNCRHLPLALRLNNIKNPSTLLVFATNSSFVYFFTIWSPPKNARRRPACRLLTGDGSTKHLMPTRRLLQWRCRIIARRCSLLKEYF